MLNRATAAPQIIREKLVKTILAGYCVWPAAHVVNFRYVPSDLRVLYINCVQVRFDCAAVILCYNLVCAQLRMANCLLLRLQTVACCSHHLDSSAPAEKDRSLTD